VVGIPDEIKRTKRFLSSTALAALADDGSNELVVISADQFIRAHQGGAS
jgi:hypothetical protein